MTRRRMRMAELSRRSGVPRETIHYYAREGLLPDPERAGKTSAYYDDSHLERLQLIRRLREEKYLPVAVIRGIFRAGLEGPSGPDLETLAEVLRIDPTLAGANAPGQPIGDEARRVALELGLLAPSAADPYDPSAQRVLSAVAQALDLDPDARELTLADMQASAPLVHGLVEAEASVFFDRVVSQGDLTAAVSALRAGRAAVARFITAQRDLTLQRIIDELLAAIRGASTRIEGATALPLGAERAARLGGESHRAELAARARRGDAAAANDLVWHLFALGNTKELLRLPDTLTGALRPRAELLVAHARTERHEDAAEHLTRLLASAGRFALGEVLAGEALLLAALRPVAGGAGVLERAVPALHRIFRADPAADADPLASALAHLRRGLLGMALPPALGRQPRAVQDLEQALGVALSAPGRLHAAVHARVEANARLSLGRHFLRSGRSVDGRLQLARARDIDPTGPIGLAAEAAISAEPPDILAESTGAG